MTLFLCIVIAAMCVSGTLFWYFGPSDQIIYDDEPLYIPSYPIGLVTPMVFYPDTTAPVLGCGLVPEDIEEEILVTNCYNDLDDSNYNNDLDNSDY